MEEEEENCPLCLLSLVRPFMSDSCLHKMCGKCAASHSWRSRSSGALTCPLCRRRIRKFISCATMGGDIGVVSLQFVGVYWDIDVDKSRENVTTRLHGLFDIPIDRLKVFAKGGRLVQDFESELYDRNNAFKLMGTPAPFQVDHKPRKMVRVFRWTKQVFQVVLNVLVALWRLLVIFFLSMRPSYRNDIERERLDHERERGRLGNQ